MNPQTMNYFVAVAEARSFSRAAESLFMTQQSLSASIASLERELGCQLLIRHIPLELTYAGTVFLKYAKAYQSDMIALQHELSDISNNQQGILRLGIAYTRSMIILPTLVSAFRKTHPNVMIETYENTDMLQQLVLGNLDLAIDNLEDKYPGVETRSFYDENILLVLSRELMAKLQVSAEEIKKALSEDNLDPLKDCPFIHTAPHGKTESVFMRLFQNSNFTPKFVCQIINTNTTLGLCLRGAGASFIQQSTVYSMLPTRSIDKLELFQLPEKYRYTISFIYTKRSYQWSMINEFINTALETYPHAGSFPFIWQ